MRKKTLISLILTVLIFSSFIAFDSRVISEASSKAEIVMEMQTRKVLSESNADAKLPMASTTKILTAIIIIEDCDLDQVIKVDDKAVGVEGSSIYLTKNEEIDIRDLLYGLMLRSGNDSAVALAIHHSGSLDTFAKVMNERAEAIGAENTHLVNPSGLSDDEHYTTARDLCKIACYAMQNETFKNIVSTINYKGKYRSFVNKNKLLKSYKGANGIKTGYTLKAGRCLVSSAERDGMDLVCVVLNCPDMYERTREIFDFGFENFELLKIDENKVFIFNKVLCKLKDSVNLVTKKGQAIEYRVVKPENENNDNAVAELQIYSQNHLLFRGKLYSI